MHPLGLSALCQQCVQLCSVCCYTGGGRHLGRIAAALKLLSAAAALCLASFDMESLSDQEGTAGKGHITNYAQNVNGTVWNLTMLKKHLGGCMGVRSRA